MKTLHLPFNVLPLALSLGLAAGLLTCGPDTSREAVIENEALMASYRPASGTFSLTLKSSGLTAVRNGRLEGGGDNARTGEVTDSVFGRGQKIEIRQESGSIVSLELYDRLPFLLVRKTYKNGENEAEIDTLTPVTFTIDLGVPAGKLKTMGTGGLMEPSKNPGSYVFLAGVDPETRRGVVAGFITQERGSGVLFSGVRGDTAVDFRARIDYGRMRLKPEASEPLETFAIGIFDDARLGLERFAGAIQKQYAITLKPRPAVYCTWYAEEHGGPADEASMRELARFVSRKLKEFGLTVLQIDDGWQDGPPLDGPRRGFEQPRPDGPYPSGFSTLAAEMEKEGLTLGLWWMPFGRNHEDPAWKDRQDWFARFADGTPLRTRMFGGTCLDLTHPAVQENIAFIARKLKGDGARYHKMDGLWTGTATQLKYINDGYKCDSMSNVSPFHDPSVTQIQAYRDGLKLIRSHAGPGVFLSGCAISQNMRSFGASFGLVDAMRVGPDFNHDGLGVKTGPLRASRYYFLNGKIWWNDPDPAKVRANAGKSMADPSASGAVSLDVARLTSTFAALTGQIFLVSDWIPNLPEERLEVLRRTMRSHDGMARPVDYFDKALPSVWLVSDTATGVDREVLGLFNWEKTPDTIGATVERTGLDPEKSYFAFDFWNNRLLPDIKGSYSFKLSPESCQAIALRLDEGRPVLLSTSAHVSQGMTDVIHEQWKDERLSGASRVVAGDPYELRIRIPHGWKIIHAEADLPVQVRRSTGLARVRMTPSESGRVAWSVAFRHARSHE